MFFRSQQTLHEHRPSSCTNTKSSRGHNQSIRARWEGLGTRGLSNHNSTTAWSVQTEGTEPFWTCQTWKRVRWQEIHQCKPETYIHGYSVSPAVKKTQHIISLCQQHAICYSVKKTQYISYGRIKKQQTSISMTKQQTKNLSSSVVLNHWSSWKTTLVIKPSLYSKKWEFKTWLWAWECERKICLQSRQLKGLCRCFRRWAL